MEIDTAHLKPDMTLMEDILGKSGKPMMEKHTTLTEQHITFLEKFKIPSVQIAPFPGKTHHERVKKHENGKNNLAYEFEHIVKYFRNVLNQIKNNVPLNHLYEIRKTFIPFFETVQSQPFESLIFLHYQQHSLEKRHWQSVAISMFAIYAAKNIGFERKDWLQIGFAGLLADIGFTKMSQQTQNEEASETPTEAYRMHPFHSYKVIEHVTTLTKQSKIAILQHHERIDGTGYPAKLTGDNMTAYAKILATTDYFVRLLKNNDLSQVIHLLDEKKGVKLDQQVTTFFIEKCRCVQEDL